MQNPQTLLHLLEETARRLTIDVRYQSLKQPAGANDEPLVQVQSGSYVLKGKRVIVVERTSPCEEKIRILTQELAMLDLGDQYIPPVVRDLLSAASKLPA